MRATTSPKIISGGQTGADQAGLDAADLLKLMQRGLVLNA